MLIKKRKLKAYKRLKNVMDMKLSNAEQEAFLLEKLELHDKKLNRPYYYEDIEPESIVNSIFPYLIHINNNFF